MIEIIINKQQNYQKQMQQRQMSRSEQKIEKMNSSMAVFRELIENLRLKNQQLIKPSTSQINPEAQKQSESQSRLYASEKVASHITNSSNDRNFIASSSSMPVFGQDQGIKLKTRGHVAGRDILNKKPTVLPSSKFNQTVENNKQHAKNKNIGAQLSTLNESEVQHPALEQVKILIKKQSSSSSKNQKIAESFTDFGDNSSFNKNMTTMPLNKPKFQQNRLNLKAISSRNKIKDIDQVVVVRYCKQSKLLQPSSQANAIYDFFDGLMNQANVSIASPFIKKFKNCIYFGAPVSEDETYEGFLYFYQQKIYYGQFLNNQKNGRGVQVILDEQIIYKGLFSQGQKTGKFMVKKTNQNYIGFLEKGIYHGKGKLQTKQSIYEGQFSNGEKHGFGEQFFPKTGVRMVGYFDQGTFSKRSKSSFSHSELQKAIKFKNPGNSRITNHSNKNIEMLRKDKLIKLNQQEAQGTRNQSFQGQNQLGLYVPPFSGSANHFYNKKTPFNKQKIRSFLPGMNHQKFVQPIPQNCRDFDYSFDVSSKRETQQFSIRGLNHVRNIGNKQKFVLPSAFGQIDQENRHLDTSALQQPLPMPSFYKR